MGSRYMVRVIFAVPPRGEWVPGIMLTDDLQALGQEGFITISTPRAVPGSGSRWVVEEKKKIFSHIVYRPQSELRGK